MWHTLRKAWPLISLLLLAIILTTFQKKSAVTGRPSALQAPAAILAYPFEFIWTGLSSVWNTISVQSARKAYLQAQNHQLRIKVEQLSVQNDQLQALSSENQRLRDLLQMRQHFSTQTDWIAADIIARHPTQWFQMISIDQGSSSGIRYHSAALTDKGIVGQVLSVSTNFSEIRLITDPGSYAGAVIQRTGDTGYVQGAGSQGLIFYFFDQDHGVRPGDQVVASPISSLYPDGVPIGVVTSVKDEPGTSMHSARVKPSANINNLKEILVAR